MSHSNIVKYFLGDYQKGFFPLETNKIIIENMSGDLHDYIHEKIFDKENTEQNFLSQMSCYASKHEMHLRRTVKLDPIAEFYIYELIYQNRNTFRKNINENRKSFGHRFTGGKPISLSASYRDFKKDVAIANNKYKYGAKLDIATYFNSVYHHDIIQWFDGDNRSSRDANNLGQFLRQINGGRSVDCLPQGIHPCKVIGAEFLKFIDNSLLLKADLILRFMDDIYMFSDKENIISHDFIVIQQLLGDKGLNVNSTKTKFGNTTIEDVENKIQEVRKQLLYTRSEIIDAYDDDFDEDLYMEEKYLNGEQEEYLYSLLAKKELEEMDVELILTFMQEKGEDVLEYVYTFLEKFPSLSKKIYYFCHGIQDKSSLADTIEQFLEEAEIVTEEQLFWIAKIAEDLLNETRDYASLLMQIYEHPNSTAISKSKILEIPENRFGMQDLRDKHLKSGQSDWLSWASAVGSRDMTKRNKNLTLTYFSNASPINHLIAKCIKKF